MMPTPEQNLAGLFQANGWWFPGGCAGGRWAKYLATAHDSDPAVERLRKNRRRTCIQAGGAQGVWALKLARQFRRVITFEVDEANWECLQRNLDAKAGSKKVRARIEAHHAALGAAPGKGQVLWNACNPHGHRFAFESDKGIDLPGKYQPLNAVDVVTIDSLGIEDLDFLALDIEGSELLAMMGGEQTIMRCRPIIIAEQRGHGEIHGLPDQALRDWLAERGYRHAGKVAKDQLWVPR
jgi:FkbM family methyltransferase